MASSTFPWLALSTVSYHPHRVAPIFPAPNREVIKSLRLKGAFQGFHDRDTVFEFQGGGKWRQNEYKHYYYYFYMPFAKVVDRDGTYYLEVDGVDNSVEIIRVW